MPGTVPAGRPSPAPSPALLWAVGVIEAVSFVALLAVAVHGDSGGARAGLGFLHGCIYLGSLAIAWWRVDDSHARNLAVIPGVGALLLARRVTRPPMSR